MRALAVKGGKRVSPHHLYWLNQLICNLFFFVVALRIGGGDPQCLLISLRMKKEPTGKRCSKINIIFSFYIFNYLRGLTFRSE
jgi:hypothetical protein